MTRSLRATLRLDEILTLLHPKIAEKYEHEIAERIRNIQIIVHTYKTLARRCEEGQSIKARFWAFEKQREAFMRSMNDLNQIINIECELAEKD